MSSLSFIRQSRMHTHTHTSTSMTRWSGNAQLVAMQAHLTCSTKLNTMQNFELGPTLLPTLGLGLRVTTLTEEDTLPLPHRALSSSPKSGTEP